MTAEGAFDVETEVYIEAPPEVVFSFFVDAERLTRWTASPERFDPRPGGSYQFRLPDENVAAGEFLEVTPNRRLVFTWGLHGGTEAVAPGSSVVEVTFAPKRNGTVVRVIHRTLIEKGDDVCEAPALYASRTADQPDLLQCEWCARSAQVVPMHVTWPDGLRELGEPVLCPVCAAIFELRPPLRDAEPGRTAREAAVERRRQDAKGIVWDLLAERYAAEGKPRPAWRGGPVRHVD